MFEAFNQSLMTPYESWYKDPYRKTSSYASVRYIEGGTFSVSGLSAVLATLARTCIFCFIYSLKNQPKKPKKMK